ncbi:MAG TPA: carboxypeptidase regulatory-like domain-containing protein [Candidatus Kapabacteria bacterium]|nr:carboxypeptidase regulatory-like domain-containing protein [Candidatus Kapabacteria bacterium]
MIPSRSLRFGAWLLPALLLAFSLASCGDDSGDDADARKPLATIDPATAATITGTVTFQGTPPAPKSVRMEADPHCNATPENETPEVTQEVVVNNGRLANVFVYLSDGVKGRYAPTADSVVLDQRGCRYHPHVLGVMVGQRMVVRNSDATLHNIHAAAKINKEFNIAQTQQGQLTDQVFKHAEVMIPVACDVHGWMRSFIGVLSHPFFAVTATDGSFTLKGVPPGTYTLTAWHEKYGTLQQKIEVKERESTAVEFAFKAP